MRSYVALLLVAVALAALLLPCDAMPRRGGGKRRGRTGDNLEAPPAPGSEGEGGEGGEGGDLPAWCDPTVEMGAWMNFDKIRQWCADNGFTEFGPYGGVPAEGEGEEGEEAPAEE